MSSTLPTSQQRLISMLAAVVVVAGLGFVDETIRDDPEEVVAAATSTEDTEEEVVVAELSGEVAVAGSEIVAPMIQLQAESFAEIAPGVTVVVASESSDDGIEAICAGTAPIASSARLMTEDEVATCEAAGVEFIELRRAVEGLTFVTAPGNDIADCVSFNDLYALLSAQATDSTSWADANAITSTWGGTQFADAPLEVYGPAEDYHTFASLGEVVIGAVASGATGLDVASGEFVAETRTDYEHVTDEELIAAIAASDSALGWVGFSSVEEAADNDEVRLLRVSREDGGTCVNANEETISRASFPAARNLYTYVNAALADENPAVAAFVDHMMSDEAAEAIVEEGFVELPNADKTRARTIWRARLVGNGQWVEEE